MTFREKLEKVINSCSQEELEYAGGNGMQLNEYIASQEFKKEMKALAMPVSVGNGGQSGY